MANKPSPHHYTSSDLEKAAIERFRVLIALIPKECRIFREIWGNSTALCLDFQDCPDLIETNMGQSFLISLAANYLGLANSVVFRVGRKVTGWKTMNHLND